MRKGSAHFDVCVAKWARDTTDSKRIYEYVPGSAIPHAVSYPSSANNDDLHVLFFLRPAASDKARSGPASGEIQNTIDYLNIIHGGPERVATTSFAHAHTHSHSLSLSLILYRPALSSCLLRQARSTMKELLRHGDLGLTTHFPCVLRILPQRSSPFLRKGVLRYINPSPSPPFFSPHSKQPSTTILLYAQIVPEISSNHHHRYHCKAFFFFFFFSTCLR